MIVAANPLASAKEDCLTESGFSADAELAFGASDSLALVNLACCDLFMVREIKLAPSKHQDSTKGYVSLPQGLSVTDFTALMARLEQGIEHFFSLRVERLLQERFALGSVTLFLASSFVMVDSDLPTVPKLTFVVEPETGLPVYWHLGSVDRDLANVNQLVNLEVLTCHQAVLRMAQKARDDMKQQLYGAVTHQWIPDINVLLALGSVNLDNFLQCYSYGLGMICHVPDYKRWARDTFWDYQKNLSRQEHTLTPDNRVTQIVDAHERKMLCDHFCRLESLPPDIGCADSVELHLFHGLTKTERELEELEKAVYALRNGMRAAFAQLVQERGLSEFVDSSGVLPKFALPPRVHKRLESEVIKTLNEGQLALIKGGCLCFRDGNYQIAHRTMQYVARFKASIVLACAHIAFNAEQILDSYKAYQKLMAHVTDPAKQSKKVPSAIMSAETTGTTAAPTLESMAQEPQEPQEHQAPASPQSFHASEFSQSEAGAGAVNVGSEAADVSDASEASTVGDASKASAVGDACGASDASDAVLLLRNCIEASTLPEDELLEHERYMDLAIALAQQAQELGEVPVGAVLVAPDGSIVATGYNRTIIDHDASAHAEIVAIREAGQKLRNYRLPTLRLYVTLEPCCMCIMAAIHARIAQVIFGTADPRTGACGSVFSISGDPRHNHRLEVIAHVKQKECARQLKLFFRMRRAEQKWAKKRAKKQAKEHEAMQAQLDPTAIRTSSALGLGELRDNGRVL